MPHLAAGGAQPEPEEPPNEAPAQAPAQAPAAAGPRGPGPAAREVAAESRRRGAGRRARTKPKHSDSAAAAHAERPTARASSSVKQRIFDKMRRDGGDPRDESLKQSIVALIRASIDEADDTLADLRPIKHKYMEATTYKLGFYFAVIKKQREVLTELFDIAVKRRGEWNALEQLRLFGMVVSTKKDLVQMVRNSIDMHNGATRARARRRGWTRRSADDSWEAAFMTRPFLYIPKYETRFI